MTINIAVILKTVFYTAKISWLLYLPQLHISSLNIWHRSDIKNVQNVQDILQEMWGIEQIAITWFIEHGLAVMPLWALYLSHVTFLP